ncbi:MAG: hypothetical protein WCL14_03345 [Bacteroidota bacterium]
MVTIDKILDEITQLDMDSRDMLIEILNKRRIEESRNEIADNACKTKKDFDAGKIKIHSAKEAIQKLNK